MAPSSAAGAAAPLAVLALLFNALTWGVSWWPFRQFEHHGLHPLWVTAMSFVVAVMLLGVARPRAFGEVLRHRSLWVLVAAAGTTNACFNWAVTVGDVVRVVLLFYLMPLWTVVLSRLLLGERLTPQAALRVALALAGAVIVLWPSASTWQAALSLPDALSLLGGFSFALNNVMLRREARRSEGARALAMFSGGALVAFVLALGLTTAGAVAAPPPVSTGMLLGVAALALWFIGSNLSLQYGAARLPAMTTAAVMVSEVLFAAISAVLLGAATLTGQVGVGGALIVAAALLAARDRNAGG
ncbi:MAG: DMT family transporter [Rubrivivax sp.]